MCLIVQHGLISVFSGIHVPRLHSYQYNKKIGVCAVSGSRCGVESERTAQSAVVSTDDPIWSTSQWTRSPSATLWSQAVTKQHPIVVLLATYIGLLTVDFFYRAHSYICCSTQELELYICDISSFISVASTEGRWTQLASSLVWGAENSPLRLLTYGSPTCIFC